MRTLALLCLLALPGAANAQTPGPQPTPLPPPIPAPVDRPYPGVIHLQVDGTDLDHRIFAIHETIPVAGGGPMIVLYPEWVPGNHSPNNPLMELAGLVFHANGQRIEWTRDPVNVFAFHIIVPDGATSIDADFQWLTPVTPRVGAVTMTQQMFDLEWIATTLYPAGYFSRDIQVAASLKLPAEWQMATALERASTNGSTTTFKTVTFNTLADSPVYAGRYFKRLDLDPNGPARVSLDVVADRPDEIAPSPEVLEAHRALVRQAYKLFASRHYDHYDFLFSLSDTLAGNGLEHHRSSEDGTGGNYFTDWNSSPLDRDLLAHEYTHSWNGKFRRPADLWTPNFNVPMRDSLLWVYEGQTEYWGYVLTARSGMWTKEQALDTLANDAATYDHVVGATWRPLEDTTNDPIIANRRPQSWRSWQRSEDYYFDGMLIWLDADTLIREKSHGAKSLDDFARAFFGIDDGSYVTVTYTFDDIVKALNDVVPYDWASFLNTRLRSVGAGAPLDGLRRGGYRLVYTDTPSDFIKAEQAQGMSDLWYSLGVVVGRDSTLAAVLWDGPAFKAGLTEGMKILAVNDVAYSVDGLNRAITAAKDSKSPIRLTVQFGERVWSVDIDYHDGMRYPHLERIAGTPATLDDILKAR